MHDDVDAPRHTRQMKYIPKGTDASMGVTRPQWYAVKENLKYTLKSTQMQGEGMGERP